MNGTIIGILLIVVAVIGLAILIFTAIKGLSRFGDLSGGSKTITILLTIISLVMMISGGFFSWKSFTAKPKIEDELTENLRDTIKENKKEKKEYTQKISLAEYIDGEESNLYNFYSEKGKADIDAYSNGSDKAKSLLLRNVGKKITVGDNTTSLDLISGKKYSLVDGKDRIIIFADTSEYSIKLLSEFKKYNTQNSDKPVEYVVVFPVSDGTEVEEMFSANTDKIGAMDKINVVTNDSMGGGGQMNLKFVAMQEYSVKDIPSYVSIDKYGIVSSAGVGTVIQDDESMRSFLDKSFNTKNKLYDEIVGSGDQDDETMSTDQSEETMESSE